MSVVENKASRARYEGYLEMELEAAAMYTALADIESEPLAMAEAAIKAKGGYVLAVRTNVMTEGDINELADAAFSTFGASTFSAITQGSFQRQRSFAPGPGRHPSKTGTGYWA